MHTHRLLCFHGVDLSGGKYQNGGLFAYPVCFRCWGTDGLLRGDVRRRVGFSLVQLSSGPSVHGGYRVAGLGWSARNNRGVDPPTFRTRYRWWSIRYGSRFWDCADDMVSLYSPPLRNRAACLPDGAAPSSFRKERMVRVSSRDPFLYFGSTLCRRGIEHAQNQVRR